MTYYIQRKDGRDLETVDAFNSYREAYDMLKEYRLSDDTASYYISSRCCMAFELV